MIRKFTALCFALISLATTACTEVINITAPQLVQEIEMNNQSVQIGDKIVLFVDIPVGDVNEKEPTGTIEIAGNRLFLISPPFASRGTLCYGCPEVWRVMFLTVATVVGTEEVTMKISSRPDKVYKQKVEVIPFQQKG